MSLKKVAPWGLIIMMGLLQTGFSQADPPSQVPQIPSVKGVTDPDRRDCGQACLQRKILESVSYRTVYEATKLAKMKQKIAPKKAMVDRYQNPAQGLQLFQAEKCAGNPACGASERDQYVQSLKDEVELEVNENLPRFCMANESGFDCFDRYRRIQAVTLLDLRQSIQERKDHIREYSEDAKQTIDFGGQKLSKVIIEVGDPINLRLNEVEKQTALKTKKKPQQTYVTTVQELQALYDFSRSNPQRPSDGVQFREWVQNYLKKRGVPPQSSFTLYLSENRDPSDPSSDLVLRQQCDANGKCVFDEKTYARVMKAFGSQFQQKYNADVQAMSLDADRVALTQKGPPKLLDENSVGKTSWDALLETRKILVETANAAIEGLKKTLTFEPKKDTARTPASGSPQTGSNDKTEVNNSSQTVPIAESKDIPASAFKGAPSSNPQNSPSNSAAQKVDPRANVQVNRSNDPNQKDVFLTAPPDGILELLDNLDVSGD